MRVLQNAAQLNVPFSILPMVPRYYFWFQSVPSDQNSPAEPLVRVTLEEADLAPVAIICEPELLAIVMVTELWFLITTSSPAVEGEGMVPVWFAVPPVNVLKPGLIVNVAEAVW